MSLPRGLTIEAGDTVLFAARDRRSYLRVIQPGQALQTHFGQIKYDDIIGVPFGEQIRTHMGHGFYVLPPSLDDMIQHLHRETQIIYAKDLGYIAMKMSITAGTQVIEAGTGSGALTMLLALLVGEEGQVFSYDRKASNQELARRNVKRLGVEHRVNFLERDITAGFDQQNVHAVFLDLPDPWNYVAHARAALRGGGFLGALVPTTNQLIKLLEALYVGQWYLLQAEELLLRPWKTIPTRVRPDEQMVGHSGILVFARAVEREVRETVEQPAEEE